MESIATYTCATVRTKVHRKPHENSTSRRWPLWKPRAPGRRRSKPPSRTKCPPSPDAQAPASQDPPGNMEEDGADEGEEEAIQDLDQNSPPAAPEQEVQKEVKELVASKKEEGELETVEEAERERARTVIQGSGPRSHKSHQSPDCAGPEKGEGFERGDEAVGR
ncbi:unnamed protein product [Caenorhabditis brenneri]